MKRIKLLKTNWVHYTNIKRFLYKQIIMENTKETRNHMTPELNLRLITKECKLWWQQYEKKVFPTDPFWAFYWPGGQAITR